MGMAERTNTKRRQVDYIQQLEELMYNYLFGFVSYCTAKYEFEELQKRRPEVTNG